MHHFDLDENHGSSSLSLLLAPPAYSVLKDGVLVSASEKTLKPSYKFSLKGACTPKHPSFEISYGKRLVSLEVERSGS